MRSTETKEVDSPQRTLEKSQITKMEVILKNCISDCFVEKNIICSFDKIDDEKNMLNNAMHSYYWAFMKKLGVILKYQNY